MPDKDVGSAIRTLMTHQFEGIDDNTLRNFIFMASDNLPSEKIKVKKQKEYQIPFDENDNMLDYQHDYRIKKWVDNYVFEAELFQDGYGRGRSAAYIVFKDKNDRRYVMRMSLFNDVIPYMVLGRIRGQFTFVKQGQKL